MGRQPRLQVPGGFFHVTTRGNRRQRTFLYDGDAIEFEAVLTRVVKALGWRVHGHCLMPNHYHLAIETPDANLSQGMQRLNGVYAKSFNYAHGLEGHLFERRFRSIAVETDSHMLELARYLALNPVRAGLCSHPSQWRWGSYRAMVGLSTAPAFLTCGWLLSQLAPDLAEARSRFAEFVDECPMAA
jgi:putative transposase